MAQWLAQATHNRLVVGSNPTGPTNLAIGRGNVAESLSPIGIEYCKDQRLAFRCARHGYGESSSTLWEEATTMHQPTAAEPALVRATALSESDIGSFQWNTSHNAHLLTFSNDGHTVEWGPRKPEDQGKHYPPAWAPASTLSKLHSGRFRWDFVVEEMGNAQIGIGFMLLWDSGLEWGSFGYLGAGRTAWSYDPSTGDVVSGTKSIEGRLPTFTNGHNGIATVHLDLPRNGEGTARFSIQGKDTRPIRLPLSSVVRPAACLLRESQRVTLANFQRE